MSNIHFKTAYGYIRRSPFQAFAAVFVLTLTFFVTTMLIVLIYSSNQLLNYFETRPQVLAFLKSDAQEESINTLKDKLSNDSRVKDIKYVSKEEALELYKDATSDNPLLAELVSPTIFPASLEFSLANLSDAQPIIDSLKGEEVVDDVEFTASLKGESEVSSVITRLKTITSYIRIGGGVFAGILLVTSFFVLMVIVSMRISTRKGEIEILDLIGATPGFIRSPILFEALIYSMVGVFIGWIITFIIVVYAAPTVLRYFGTIPVLPSEALHLVGFFAIILGVEVVAGVALALIGTFVAASPSRK